MDQGKGDIYPPEGGRNAPFFRSADKALINSLNLEIESAYYLPHTMITKNRHFRLSCYRAP